MTNEDSDLTDEKLERMASAFHTEYGTWNFRGRNVTRLVDGSYATEEEVMAVCSSVDEAAERCSEMADIAAARAFIAAMKKEATNANT